MKGNQEGYILLNLTDSVISGDSAAAALWAREAVAVGLNPLQALDEGVIRGIKEVEDGFVTGDCFLPELARAGEALKAAISVLEDDIQRRGMKRAVRGKMVIGTVRGDIHDIGKGIVSSLLNAESFLVLDLGVDLPNEKFMEAVREHQPDILGMSCLLTTCLPRMEEVIQNIVMAGLRDQITIIVGGSPVTQRVADRIGADLYGTDAIDAAEKLRSRF